jgi:hypothetical protein
MTWANSSVTVTRMLQTKFEVNLLSSFREEDDCWLMTTDAEIKKLWSRYKFAAGNGNGNAAATIAIPLLFFFKKKKVELKTSWWFYWRFNFFQHILIYLRFKPTIYIIQTAIHADTSSKVILAWFEYVRSF